MARFGSDDHGAQHVENPQIGFWTVWHHSSRTAGGLVAVYVMNF